LDHFAKAPAEPSPIHFKTGSPPEFGVVEE